VAVEHGVDDVILDVDDEQNAGLGRQWASASLASEPVRVDTGGMDPRVREIIEKGSPAQAMLARTLSGAAIELLYDAYLNDPYLTRN
jgi:hypothetical protein